MQEPRAAGECYVGRLPDLHNLLTETSVGNIIGKLKQSIDETAILVRNLFRTLTSVRTEAALRQARGDVGVSQLLRSQCLSCHATGPLPRPSGCHRAASPLKVPR
jgi:hypothetical protein